MTVHGLKFDNTYLNLPDKLYTRLQPTPVPSPEMVILNEDLAAYLGVEFSELSEDDQAALFSGNKLPEEADPFAQAYAGHQFGHFTMLGDGRAHVWGEHISPDGLRFDIQFKGSGRTPYSRRGDGRAALGPMLREYIISEAMHSLAIPTTRSLAVVTTGENVIRDEVLPGAVLTRVASSHIRVGTFEFVAAQEDTNLLKTLLDYTIHRHYSGIEKAHNKAIAFLSHMMERQADLLVHWMRVGFIHGVMNTDSMAISGETIDYGPCAFMDTYDPNTVFSSIDHVGRYAYANQPGIAQWNVARLAETLLPLIDKNMDAAVQMAEEVINSFPELYQAKWFKMMRSKLGLFGEQVGDAELIKDLLTWMQDSNADYTNTFLELSQEQEPSGDECRVQSFRDWYARWQKRLEQNTESFESSISMMKQSNPAVIPRNHIVEDVLKAASEGNLKPLHQFLDVLKSPYENRRALKNYQFPPTPGDRVYQTFCGT